MTEQTALYHLSARLEALMVDRNPRGMAVLSQQLESGYAYRAARLLWTNRNGKILIGTGFPVANTFETDGPAGAMALYEALDALGADVCLACPPSLAAVLAPTHQVIALHSAVSESSLSHCQDSLARFTPDLIVAIEVPGCAADGHYYNIRGIDISAQCGNFEDFVRASDCPVIAIGDGGNELGMGSVDPERAELPIKAAATPCTELVIADVSNWGGYALVAFLGYWANLPFLDRLIERPLLEWLRERGAVDGVTHASTATEDGLPMGSGNSVIRGIQSLFTDFSREP